MTKLKNAPHNAFHLEHIALIKPQFLPLQRQQILAQTPGSVSVYKSMLIHSTPVLSQCQQVFEQKHGCHFTELPLPTIEPPINTPTLSPLKIDCGSMYVKFISSACQFQLEADAPLAAKPHIKNDRNNVHALVNCLLRQYSRKQLLVCLFAFFYPSDLTHRRTTCGC